MGYSSLRELYNAADVYVSPYMAEGFNMPALEAQACGTPLIVPRGGPTDDFIHKGCAIFLPTEEVGDQEGRHKLITKPGDLENAMMQFVKVDGEGAAISDRAAVIGPAYVEEKFTWDIVAREMVKYFVSLI
jgi:glycosyltransferase involved in cell wall biosynthesis